MKFFRKNIKEIVVLFYLLSLLLIGLFMQPLSELWVGLKLIFITPGVLVSDYMFISGIGPTLVNGSLVGLIGFVIVKINKIPVSGPIIAAIFTMLGFGFFGKNIYSIFPIIIGVWIYSKLKKEKFQAFILPALFGTALAPLVTQIIFGYEWNIFLAILIGVGAGFIIPPLALHLLKTHSGYNLYNIGFTCGFIGLIFVSFIRSFGIDSQTTMLWGHFNISLNIIFGLMFISMIIIALIINHGRFKDYMKILKQPGTLVTDLVVDAGFGNTLLNMGFVGLIGLGYIFIVGGDLNGPTTGGILTMVGFAAFGKHPRNIIPVMFGVFLGSLITTEFQINDPVVVLAVLFGTTLAPLSGQFGVFVGIIAGFLHMVIVSNVTILHGGLNLYNNGFAAGFVAIIIIALIGGFKRDHKEEKNAR